MPRPLAAGMARRTVLPVWRPSEPHLCIALLCEPRYGYTAGMDEIIIEEKKYVSSKQAAKITGYAKDYIGQLCREGRVPARLVGRSWYVLESAIQDHRFGNQEAEEPKETVKTTQSGSFSVSETWEFPRYESSHSEILPTVNRLQASEAIPEQEEVREDAPEAPHDLHESWKEWFDHVADSLSAAEEPDEVAAALEPLEEERQPSIEEEVVSVPLHVMRQQRIIEREIGLQDVPEYQSNKKEGSNTAVLSIQVAAVLFAAISVALAAIASGYFDSYMISDSQAQVISGISVYNK